jgi:hypothetical protein
LPDEIEFFLNFEKLEFSLFGVNLSTFPSTLVSENSIFCRFGLSKGLEAKFVESVD